MGKLLALYALNKAKKAANRMTSGYGAPSNSEGEKGSMYIDKNTGIWYQCTGVYGTYHSWEKIEKQTTEYDFSGVSLGTPTTEYIVTNEIEGFYDLFVSNQIGNTFIARVRIEGGLFTFSMNFCAVDELFAYTGIATRSTSTSNTFMLLMKKTAGSDIVLSYRKI